VQKDVKLVVETRAKKLSSTFWIAIFNRLFTP
jgi:hypothetical protein